MRERERINPFWRIVEAAGLINTRYPKTDQPDEHNALVRAVQQAQGQTRKAALFELMNRVVEETAPIQSLYALARELKMKPVADGASAVIKVLREGASFEDLQNASLAETKSRETDRGTKAYVVYHVGRNALENAVDYFRGNSQIAFAQVLEKHLRQGERNRALAKTRHNAEEQKVAVA